MIYCLKVAGILILLTALFSACKKEKTTIPVMPKFEITDNKVTLNPTGYSPLAATISLKTSVKTKITLNVTGKHGPASDVVKEFDEFATIHDIPVLGLYPDYANSVVLSFYDENGTEIGQSIDTIYTNPLPDGVFPDITINVKKDSLVAKGMTLVNYFGYNDNPYPQKPFIFDAFGDIRWYADFRTSPVLNGLFYDDGPERLRNGNLYFGDGNTNAIYEIDMLGNIVNTWDFPGYGFHHNVQEKPNGNFLVTVTKLNSSTIEDYIIEIDRNTKQIIRTWDLQSSLQYSRQVLFDNTVDWIHVNAVIYDERDNTIIVSGRTQGLIKLDENNQVVWIMGSHKGWGTAGNGTDLNNFLLQPLDQNNLPLTSQDVLDGNINHADFEWNWYQHAPLLMPDGNIMIFDNGGDNRNFSGVSGYSRAVEFDINSENKTVKQIWQYGKERGRETYSIYVSDVDYLPAENHVIFSPGGVPGSAIYGKVVEIDYSTREVVFEVTITPLVNTPGICFHRTERLSLYP